MRKNVASQSVVFQLVSSTDGTNVTTGSPTVYVTIDAGTQATGTGTVTHEGNGAWSYVPAQAETNGDHVAFTMVLSGAVSQTVNAYPVSFDPTDAVRMGLTALPNAAADAAGGLPISDAGGLDLDAIKTVTDALPNGGALTDISSAITVIDGIVDAILVDTDTTIPATLTTIAGYIDTEVAAIQAVTAKLDDTLEDDGGTFRFTTNALEQAPSGGGGGDATAANQAAISAAIAALNDLSAAQVNAEVLDVLSVDTFSEPPGVPAATASLVDKISWVFTVSRNKLTQTATTAIVRNDADDANIASASVSDDGTTLTRGEYS